MKYLALLLCLSLCACSYKAKTHVAPDSAPVLEAQRAIKRHVIEARQANMRAVAEWNSAGIAHGKSLASAKAETERLLTLRPRVDSLLAVVPEDLKPQVEALSVDVQSIERQHAATVLSLGDTATHLAAGLEHQNAVEKATARAEARSDELEQKLSPAYLNAVEAQTELLNRTELKLADAENLATHRGRLLGFTLAIGAALAATRLVTLTNPYSFAYPVGAGLLAYGLGRWML